MNLAQFVTRSQAPGGGATPRSVGAPGGTPHALLYGRTVVLDQQRQQLDADIYRQSAGLEPYVALERTSDGHQIRVRQACDLFICLKARMTLPVGAGSNDFGLAVELAGDGTLEHGLSAEVQHSGPWARDAFPGEGGLVETRVMFVEHFRGPATFAWTATNRLGYAQSIAWELSVTFIGEAVDRIVPRNTVEMWDTWFLNSPFPDQTTVALEYPFDFSMVDLDWNRTYVDLDYDAWSFQFRPDDVGAYADVVEGQQAAPFVLYIEADTGGGWEVVSTITTDPWTYPPLTRQSYFPDLTHTPFPEADFPAGTRMRMRAGQGPLGNYISRWRWGVRINIVGHVYNADHWKSGATAATSAQVSPNNWPSGRIGFSSPTTGGFPDWGALAAGMYVEATNTQFRFVGMFRGNFQWSASDEYVTLRCEFGEDVWEHTFTPDPTSTFWYSLSRCRTPSLMEPGDVFRITVVNISMSNPHVEGVFSSWFQVPGWQSPTWPVPPDPDSLGGRLHA